MNYGKRIFISGPMTGIEDYNLPAFYTAEKKLRRLGYEIFNPASIKGDDNWIWKDYMRECLKALPHCSHIYMLKGWEESRGANLEFFIANQIGIKIMYEKKSRSS